MENIDDFEQNQAASESWTHLGLNSVNVKETDMLLLSFF